MRPSECPPGCRPARGTGRPAGDPGIMERCPMSRASGNGQPPVSIRDATGQPSAPFAQGAGDGGLLDRESLAAGLSARSSRRSILAFEERLRGAFSRDRRLRFTRRFPDSPSRRMRSGFSWQRTLKRIARGALPESVHPRPPVQPGNGLHAMAAHERRHLWQAWRVREAAERAIAA